MTQASARRAGRPPARARSGQALAELVLAAPLLVLIVAIPLAAMRQAGRRLDALAAAREAGWDATVSPPFRASARPAGLRISVDRDGRGRVRVVATSPAESGADRAPLAAAARLDTAQPVGATLEIHVVPLAVGTEASGRDEIRRRWLGGRPTSPLRGLLRGLLGEDPVRVDFSAVPPETGR